MEYTPSARNAKSIALIALWLFGLAALHLWFGAIWYIVAGLALPLIPALIEQVRNPTRWFRITADTISWFDGITIQEVPLARVQTLRLDTRWDLSVRARLDLKSGQKVVLPPTVTPDHNELERVAQSLGITTERHHFRVF